MKTSSEEQTPILPHAHEKEPTWKDEEKRTKCKKK